MIKRISLAALLPLVLAAGAASAQDYPVLDKIAAKVVAKYQNATCEQLWEQKQQPKQQSPEEQRVIGLLKSDPQMQQAFFAKVSAPIVTKMFQCGMIP
jgi:hypothetical protein